MSNFGKNYKSAKNDENLIGNFMKQNDWPSWFRGLSYFQLEAANSLLNNIRDDTEQGTTHRVRSCLMVMGLEPLVNNKTLNLAMRMSGGNDLAFLWFLMELNYRDTCSECTHLLYVYNVNEQLILSTIAHLDMIPTLRELDRILPPAGQKSPKQSCLSLKGKCRKSYSSAYKPRYVLPYFEKLRAPVLHQNIIKVPPIDYSRRLAHYAKYLDRNYVVPNECNRWYEFYNLNMGQRIAKHITEEILEKLFGDYYPLTDRIDAALCEHHQVTEARKQTIERRLKVAARDACLQKFDVLGKRKRESYRRIIDDLKNDIGAYRNQYKALSDKGDKSSMLNMPTKSQTYKNSPPAINRKTTSSENVNQDGENAPKNSQNNETSTPGIDTDLNKKPASSKTPTDNCDSFGDRYFKNYDYGHIDNNYLKASERVFEAPEQNKPYKFQYAKIFNLQKEHNPVQTALADALESGDPGSLETTKSPTNIDVSVRKCCTKVWRHQVHKRNIAEKEAMRHKLKELQNKPKSPLNYSQHSYDPHDERLMDSMLYDAIQYMRKNPKFVLASLPDAHKIPIFREWIRVRYGMKYLQLDKRKSVEFSRKIFHTLKKHVMNVQSPNLDELGTNRFISYRCRNYAFKKGTYIREKYYHTFKMTFLDEVRVLWAAMAPYRSLAGPPKKTFFAYLPSNADDIYLFRPWKKWEFMDAKLQWDRRQRVVTKTD